MRVVMLAAIMLAWGLIRTAAAFAAFAGQQPADAALFVRLDADGNGQVALQEVPVEHRQLFDRLLRKSDVNHDKKLSRDEFLAGLVPSQAAKPLDEKLPAEFPGADAIRWLLLSMDTNGDGSVNSAEVPEQHRATFQTMTAQIDRDKNSVLDRQELSQGGRFLSNIATRASQQQQVDVAAELKKLEKSLGPSFNRFEGQRGPQPGLGLGNPLQARQTFAQLDANGDGQIILAEFPQGTRPNFQRLLGIADRDGNGRLSEQEFVAGVRQLGGRRGGPRAGLRAGEAPRRRGGPQPVLEALRGGSAGDGQTQGMDAMPGDDK